MGEYFLSNPSWSTAYDFVRKGRSGVTRPTYSRYFSLRLVEPDNPQTDITLNNRYRHVVLDPKASTKWLRRMTPEDREKAIEEYGEITTPYPEEDEESVWSDIYRRPTITYKYPNIIEMDHRQARFHGMTKTIKDYTGLRDVLRRGNVFRLRQSTDPIKQPTRKNICRRCQGARWMVFTYWNGHGVSDEDREAFNLEFSDLYYHNGLDLNELHHPTQVVKLACPKCSGLGIYVSPWLRHEMFEWTSGIIQVNSDTRLLIPQEGGICTQ